MHLNCKRLFRSSFVLSIYFVHWNAKIYNKTSSISSPKYNFQDEHMGFSAMLPKFKHMYAWKSPLLNFPEAQKHSTGQLIMSNPTEMVAWQLPSVIESVTPHAYEGAHDSFSFLLNQSPPSLNSYVLRFVPLQTVYPMHFLKCIVMIILLWQSILHSNFALPHCSVYHA